MLEMTRPQKLHRGQKPSAIPPRKDPEKLRRLGEYNIKDVEATREAYYLMPALLPEEQESWLLTEVHNARGVPIDRALAEAGRAVAIAVKPILNRELATITNGQVAAVTQVPALKRWLAAAGHSFESLGKKQVAKALLGPLDPVVRRVLKLR
jgi:hypothetical protein